MSTHANIYMPIGDLVLYKHFDGHPRHILPILSQAINESSIFLTTGRNGGGTPMWKGSDQDLLDEMGFLAHRIIVLFTIKDYQRRTSTGIVFEDRDLTGLVSPIKICTDDSMGATYHFRIQRNGDIVFYNSFEEEKTGKTSVLPHHTDMKSALYQLAVIDGDEDNEPD